MTSEEFWYFFLGPGIIFVVAKYILGRDDSMDVKELIGEFAKGAKKGAKKTASPFKPEVKLNVQFNDDMREDLEHIMRNLDSITKTRLKEINDSINPLIKESVAKMEWRWKSHNIC